MTKENLEQKHDYWRRLVEEQKQSNLSQKEFCNQRNIVLSQFVLWYRRLEKGRFIFARDTEGCIEMSPKHFEWLLASDKYSRLDAMRPHQIENFC